MHLAALQLHLASERASDYAGMGNPPVGVKEQSVLSGMPGCGGHYHGLQGIVAAGV